LTSQTAPAWGTPPANAPDDAPVADEPTEESWELRDEGRSVDQSYESLGVIVGSENDAMRLLEEIALRRAAESGDHDGILIVQDGTSIILSRLRPLIPSAGRVECRLTAVRILATIPPTGPRVRST